MSNTEYERQQGRISDRFMKFSLRWLFKNKEMQSVRSPSRAPTPPGQMLERFILPRLKLSPEDVVKRTDISSDELQLIFGGKIAISPEIGERLRPALGDYVAKLISNHQAVSDHYKNSGNWPPSP